MWRKGVRAENNVAIGINYGLFSSVCDRMHCCVGAENEPLD